MTDNRRSQTRYSVNLDVQVTHENETSEQSLLNLSLGGALLTYSKRLDIGSQVQVSFRVPSSDTPIVIGGQVRWASEMEAGVQFDGLRARDVWSLNEFFKTLDE